MNKQLGLFKDFCKEWLVQVERYVSYENEESLDRAYWQGQVDAIKEVLYFIEKEV